MYDVANACARSLCVYVYRRRTRREWPGDLDGPAHNATAVGADADARGSATQGGRVAFRVERPRRGGQHLRLARDRRYVSTCRMMHEALEAAATCHYINHISSFLTPSTCFLIYIVVDGAPRSEKNSRTHYIRHIFLTPWVCFLFQAPWMPRRK